MMSELQSFLQWVTPVLIFILGGIVAHIFGQIRSMRHEAEAIRKEGADSVLRLAQETVSRGEFVQLEKRIEQHTLSVRDSMQRIEGGIERLHQRIDELNTKRN